MKFSLKISYSTAVASAILITGASFPSQSLGSELDSIFLKRPTFTDLGVGSSSACAVSDQGEVWCWGSNSRYQTASRVSTFESTPFRVIGVTNALQVAVGKEHTCALLVTRRILCWGSNELGQLGTGLENSHLSISPIPQYVNGLIDVNRVVAGDDHTCAITVLKELYCWGSNESGQLGQLSGEESSSNKNRSVIAQPERVEISNVIDLGLGKSHSCAVTATGFVYCWGSNALGQLGLGWRTDRSYRPHLVGPLVNIRKIDSSGNSVCALNNLKILSCWGAGESGQLGSTDTSDLPLPLNSNSTLAKYSVEDFSVGVRSTCAKIKDSGVYCWGSNSWGQVVAGSNAASNTLSPFLALPYPFTDTKQINSGADFSCVLAGTVWCWGRNELGQLGQMTRGTLATYSQINNPRWDLGQRAITHRISSNVISLAWPQIGVSQRYARVESGTGRLLCQTNTALTCDFILDKMGNEKVVLTLQVLDINGNIQSIRGEYALFVESLMSAAEAKQTSDLEASQKTALEKLIEENEIKRLEKLANDLVKAREKLQAAESKLLELTDLLEQTIDLRNAAKDRSSVASDSLEFAVQEYAKTVSQITKIISQVQRN